MPAALVGAAAAQGMDTLALTDRDGLYGAVKFVLACRSAGIAPVLGADLAVEPTGLLTGLPPWAVPSAGATGAAGAARCAAVRPSTPATPASPSSRSAPTTAPASPPAAAGPGCAGSSRPPTCAASAAGRSPPWSPSPPMPG